MSPEDYNYFVNEVFGKTADTYEECFDEGIDRGWQQAKEYYTKFFKTEIKKRVSKEEWKKISNLFEE